VPGGVEDAFERVGVERAGVVVDQALDADRRLGELFVDASSTGLALAHQLEPTSRSS
jgi:hypothetical protein